jgi:hypothetical protein
MEEDDAYDLQTEHGKQFAGADGIVPDEGTQQPEYGYGGNEVAPFTDHGGNEVAPFTDHGGDEVAPFTDHGGDEAASFTGHGLAVDDSTSGELDLGNGKDFATNFKNCMSTMGMPAPTELFGTYEKALASAALITVAVEKFGTAVTVAELVGAGLLSEVFLVIGACGAAAYLGVCGGCVITAAKESLIG